MIKSTPEASGIEAPKISHLLHLKYQRNDQSAKDPVNIKKDEQMPLEKSLAGEEKYLEKVMLDKTIGCSWAENVHI